MPKNPTNLVSSTLSQVRIRGHDNIMNNPYFGMPGFVQFEVTTRCNIMCKNCLRTLEQANYVNRDMPLSFFKSIVDQLKYPTKSVHIVGMGEPLLHPDIFSMISYAKKKGFEVSLIDNFTLVDREKSLKFIASGLDFLYISFDSPSKEIFEELRAGACFEKVIENIRILVRTKEEMKAEKPVFIFKSTISKFNLHELPQLVKLAEDLGANGINFGKMMSEEDSSTKILANRFTEKDLPKSTIFIDPCEMSDSYLCDGLRGCYITVDGKVLPCGLIPESAPRAKYDQFILGDLHLNTISEIWRSSVFKRFRKKIRSGEYLPWCKTCAGYKKPSKKS